MGTAQQSYVILSLSKDLGTGGKENSQRLSCCHAKILRLRTPCSAQNDRLGKLLTPNSSLLTISVSSALHNVTIPVSRTVKATKLCYRIVNITLNSVLSDHSILCRKN